MDQADNTSRMCAPASKFTHAAALAALCVSSLFIGAAHAADDPCAGFKWNVAHERQLFASSAQNLTAARDGSSLPAMEADRLYDLALTPQDQVQFPVPPGKKMLADGAYAGFARLHVPAAGTYRIALDQAFWVDVVDGVEPVRSADFTGQPGCRAPHKIVQYQLHGGDYTLQLSGAVSAHVLITLTQVP